MRSSYSLLILPLVFIVEAVIIAVLDDDTVPKILSGISILLGQPYNTLLVLIGTTLLGLCGGVTGTFAVLRRRSMVGDAVAHASLPGLCFAFLFVGHRHFGAFLAGAMISGLAGALSIVFLQRHTRIKADAAIGTVLSVLYGLGIVLSRIIQDDPTGQQAGLDSFLLGKTAGMVSQDIHWIAIVAINVLIVTALLMKEFTLLSFDSNFAVALGWPVFFIDVISLGLLVVTVIIGLPAVGVVLMAAMVILPGVSARFWSDRFFEILQLSAIFGMFAAFVGTLISSAHPDLPAGAVIVLTGTSLFIVSGLLAPKRGIIARIFIELKFRLKVERENLLRTFYEAGEAKVETFPDLSLDRLMLKRSLKKPDLLRIIFFARLGGDVVKSAQDRYRLSDVGLKKAAKVVKNHRLWEIFLVRQASIASDHVDRDADEIEHLLSPEMLDELEQELRREGRWPDPLMPDSVHEPDQIMRSH